MAGQKIELVPHLVVDGAAAAIEFYEQAFDAEERYRMPTPDGSKVLHAEIAIGECRVMLCDPFCGQADPRGLGGSPVTLHLQVPDVDLMFARALAAGATAIMEPSDAFWGDRYGQIRDPFGHAWSLASKVRDVSEAEMNNAVREMFAD